MDPRKYRKFYRGYLYLSFIHIDSLRKIGAIAKEFNDSWKLAEREGFEPSVEFPLHTLSKRAPSTTRTSLL